MKKILFILSTIVFYITSCYLCHREIEYNYKTRWLGLKPTRIDLIWCYTPLFNTVYSVASKADRFFDQPTSHFN